MKNLTDDKKFRNTIKPIFSNKATVSSNVTLIEDKKLLTSEKDITETLNNHFVESVKTLVDNNDSCSAYITKNPLNTYPIAGSIEKFRYQSSILSIKRNRITTKFSLQYFSEEDILSEIKKLKTKKKHISPIFKTGDSSVKKNYRPVSVLHTISKLFKNL